RYISFYGKTDGGAYTFDPPQLVSRVGEAPGTATDSIGESTKHDGEVRIVRTFVERTTLQIGTQTVPAIHIHLFSKCSGRANGTSVDDVWVEATYSTPLKWTRDIDTKASTVFGNVRYQEHASFTLASMTPQT